MHSVTLTEKQMCAHTLQPTVQVCPTLTHEHTCRNVDTQAHLQEQMCTKCAALLPPRRHRLKSTVLSYNCAIQHKFSNRIKKAVGSQLEAWRQNQRFKSLSRYYHGWLFLLKYLRIRIPHFNLTMTLTVMPFRQIRSDSRPLSVGITGSQTEA